MPELTPFGMFHTAIGLIAVVYGVIALARDKQISPKNHLGQFYLVATLVTAVSALALFRQGGFGLPHALAVWTLIALAIGTTAAGSSLFGRASPYVQAASYSITMLFHLIAAVTAWSTRFPPTASRGASSDATIAHGIDLALVLAFLVGATLQALWLRRTLPPVIVDRTGSPPLLVPYRSTR